MNIRSSMSGLKAKAKKARSAARKIKRAMSVLRAYRHTGKSWYLLRFLIRDIVIQIHNSIINFEGAAKVLCATQLDAPAPGATSQLEPASNLDNVMTRKMRNRIYGLHSLLPKDDRFTYSILIPVYKPKPEYFRKALKSALDQTPPHFEVLLGLDGEQPQGVLDVIEAFKQDIGYALKLKVIAVDRKIAGGGISNTTNAIAQHATGNFLLLMDHDDWIRPDLLYRYEQCMRLYRSVDHLILFCNENKINDYDLEVIGSHVYKPEQPVFPYIFVNYICHCLLVPKALWNQIGGLRPECDGAQDFDLCLRLDVAGASFQNVPFCLYSWRTHSSSTASNPDAKGYATQAGIRALADYAEAKKLSWKIEEGRFKTSYRAIPPERSNYPVVAIVPYKDQKEMTLKAIRSALDQQGVKIHVTAIDNGSQDASIADALKEWGVEVIRVNEPFNYSRLNNTGIRLSRYAAESDGILLLNNDVELDPYAVSEMARWINQPKIGMVGARLHYPDGRFQHGGVVLSQTDGPPFQMTWAHIGGGAEKDSGGLQQVINICDAVTAACLLIRRETFLRVGGFDEIWYPVAFSDTDLALKVKKLGLHALYTPYAFGTHYESASRGPGMWEGPEASYWQFRNTEFRDQLKEKLDHSVLFR